MRLREIITVLGGAAAAWPLTVRAQQPERMRRVGMFLGAAANDPEGHARVLAVVQAVAIIVGGTLLGALASSASRAQVPDSGSTGAISLGNRGWPATQAVRASPSKDRIEDSATGLPEFSIRAGFASDYIYRGTTLSDHKPAVGAAIEATWARAYAGASMTSVKLPTQPVAEITISAGVRPTIGNIDFDIGVTSFRYPNEAAPGPTNGIDYWEAAVRADRRIGESIRAAGLFAYSPNVSNTGAWSQYAAGGLGFDVPKPLLPEDLGLSFTAGAGYSWFGNQSPVLGGFRLPAYLNWQAGATFTRKIFNLDLRYYDTNLSKENCFVFTGDPNAQPGGRVDPVTNPNGLVSRWCSATFVAKVWFALK